jgi:signal transduction histidine kinase
VTLTTTRASFGAVYLRLAVIALVVMAGFLTASRLFVMPQVVRTKTESLESLFRSHEQDILLNKTRSLRDELLNLGVIGSDDGFHNYFAEERAAVTRALKECTFTSPSICLGNAQSVFLKGNSSHLPRENFNYAIVLDTDLWSPSPLYIAAEALAIVGIALVFWLLYRAIAEKEALLLERLNRASAAFSNARDLFAIDNVGEDEFDTFGRSAEELVKGLVEYKDKFEKKTRLEQLGLFVGKMSHDLKAPLNEMENFLKAYPLLLRTASPETIEACVQSLLERVRQGKADFESALQLTRKVSTQSEKIKLNDLVAQVIGRAKANDKLANLSVSYDGPPNLVVRGNSLRLQTALLNLMENSAEEKQDASIEVRAEAAGPGIARITIADNGRGIPAHYRDQLFQPLATFKGNGTGLGLFSTREILAQHGATIGVVPTQQGAVFEIKIPAQEVSHA